MPERVAVFAGTFDPVSRGHLDVIGRAAPLFDRLVVAVSAAGKDTLFPLAERVALLRPLVSGFGNVEVAPFEGLLVEFARARGARALIRGVRTYQDWEYEQRMVHMNRHLAPEIETLFVAPAPELAFLSSSLVREVAGLGGDLSGLVPAAVAAALRTRLPPRAR
jgi:pantetheine-phosphate adenylyltransferase